MQNTQHPLRRVIGTGNKKITISAGLHGDEPQAMLVALKLVDLLQTTDLPSDLQIIIYPQINTDGLLSQTREWHGVDLNRSGADISGPAAAYLSLLKQDIAESKFYLDIHNFVYARNSLPVYVFTSQLAEYPILCSFLAGANLTTIKPLLDGDGERGTLAYLACQQKVPSCILELSSDSADEADSLAQKIMRGILWRGSGDKSPQIFESVEKQHAKQDGLFVGLVQPGTILDPHSLVGRFYSLSELEPEEIRNQKPGILQHIHINGLASQNRELFVIINPI